MFHGSVLVVISLSLAVLTGQTTAQDQQNAEGVYVHVRTCVDIYVLQYATLYKGFMGKARQSQTSKADSV